MQTSEAIHGIPVEELVAFVRRLAYRLARRLPREIRVDDLISSGHLGLLDARKRFDPSRQRGFQHYAKHRIVGAMLDELRARDPMSRDQRAGAKALAHTVARLTAEIGRPPEDAELALELGLSLTSLYTTRENAQENTSCSFDDLVETRDEPAREDTEETLLNTIEAKRIIEFAQACLEERRCYVFLAYNHDGLRLREIAELLSVTESRVCQLLGEATTTLQAEMARRKSAPQGAPSAANAA